MQTSADDDAVLDQLESDLVAVEVALAELDRLGDIGSGAPIVDGSPDRASAVRAVMADPRFGSSVSDEAATGSSVSDEAASENPVSDEAVGEGPGQQGSGSDLAGDRLVGQQVDALTQDP